MAFGDYELRNIALDPKSPPSIEIILTLSSHPATSHAIATFATHFNFQHIHIPSLLTSILNDPDHARRQRALSPLHASTLADILERKERVPAEFLMQILKRRIDGDVCEGWRGFVISGLAEDANAAKLFCRKIAHPSAVFAFLNAEEVAQQYEARIEGFYRPRLLTIPVDEWEEGLFEKLLLAIGERVSEDGGVLLPRDGFDRRYAFEGLKGASRVLTESGDEQMMVENSSEMDISDGSDQMLL